MRPVIDHVACWHDEQASEPTRIMWSVSTCEADGSEVACIGGEWSRSDAWQLARDLADDLAVPAVLLDLNGIAIARHGGDRGSN